MTLPLDLQIEIASICIFTEAVDILITKGEETWIKIHAFTTENLLVDINVRKNLIDNARNFKRAMAFAQAIRKFDLVEAKRLHDAILTYENNEMEKQLFEKNKAKGLVMMRADGKIESFKGEDEVARQWGKSMKTDCNEREKLFNDAKYIKENCPLAMMMV